MDVEPYLVVGGMTTTQTLNVRVIWSHYSSTIQVTTAKGWPLKLTMGVPTNL